MNDNIETGKRIEACRKRMNMTLEEVGAALGLHRSTILRYERGFTAKIKLPIIERLAQVLDTTPSYLLYGFDRKEDAEKQTLPTGREQLRSHIPYEPITDGQKLPPYSLRDTRLRLFRTAELLRLWKQGRLEPYFLVCAEGDDMTPRIHAGDYVVVEKEQEVENGQIALLGVADAVILRKIIRHRHGVTLVAFNPNVEPVVYSNEDIRALPVAVIGRAIEVHGSL